jgi:catechol 2,3-dioxygenase-like lactoylglutathione lyase family enzyme
VTLIGFGWFDVVAEAFVWPARCDVPLGRDGGTAMKQRTSLADAKPVLSGTEAFVYVADFQPALDFYTSRLGFSTILVYGDPPYFGLVGRDRARLALTLVCGAVFNGDVRERQELLSAAFTLDSAPEIEALYREFENAGVDFHLRLTKQPWGACNVIVRDPDRNLILFASPAG